MPSKPAPRPKPKPAKPKATAARSAKTPANGVRKANGHFVNGHGAPGPGRPRSGAPGALVGSSGYLNAEAIRRALVAEQRRRPTLFDHLTVTQRSDLAAEGGLTPLQFLMSVMLDPVRYMDVRIDAAKALAPYFHRKMPQAIELPQDAQGGGLDLTRLLALPRSEREALLTLLKKVGVDLGAPVANPALPMVERLTDPDDA